MARIVFLMFALALLQGCYLFCLFKQDDEPIKRELLNSLNAEEKDVCSPQNLDGHLKYNNE